MTQMHNSSDYQARRESMVRYQLAGRNLVPRRFCGEATHGTSEFYRFRARVTRELIERKDFNMVAVEADWPDAARINHYVCQLTTPPSEWRAFTRFPPGCGAIPICRNL